MAIKKGSPLLIIATAIIIVIIVSLLPLSKWTGGRVKDFSLFSDILKEVGVMEDVANPEEEIDPELVKAMKEAEERNPLTTNDSVLSQPIDTIISAPKAPRQGGIVVIEDYTTDGVGLIQFRHAIETGSLARVAVVGDSYIEGDIFTQDLREKLQDAYGGAGVGYVSMHSDFPGFRKSVRQEGKGWKTFMANKKPDPRYIDLAEQYSLPTGPANAAYRGTDAFAHTSSWERSRFLFISPQNSVINVKTEGGEWEERNIAASDSVQCIEVATPTSSFELKTASTSLVCLGVWLDGVKGVSLDCMSSRGFSGITLTKVNVPLCRQMASFIDYNLIILEFGINAMSASQKNYSLYSSRMVDVINHVRRCYPRADILVMGVGDRGEKRGGTVRSMSTAPAMISAQRDAARRAHCLFWDTREAMGGEDAVVEWSNAGLINKDYIHMTHKGGARLADELFKAIQHNLQ